MHKTILPLLLAGLATSAPMLWADAIGTWRVYPAAGTTFSQAVLLQDRVFYLSGNTLYAADTSRLDVVTEYTRLNGLNDSGITGLAVSDSLAQLGIVYSNGNIDLMGADGTVRNLPDLKEKTIAGDKTIHSVLEQDGRLYISAGYGFVVVDMDHGVFADSYILNTDVDYAFASGDSLYFSSEGSYYRALRTTANSRLDSWDGPIANSGQFDTIIYRTDALAQQYATAIIRDHPGTGPMGTSTARMAVSNGTLTTITSHYMPAIIKGWGNLMADVSRLDIGSGTWSYLLADDITAQVPDSLQKKKTKLCCTWALLEDKLQAGRYYISSGVSGLFAFEGDSLTDIYNHFTVPEGLDLVSSTRSYTRIGALYQDDDGYLWMANCATDGPVLRCLSPSGQWFRYPIEGFNNVEGYDYGFTNTIIQAENDGGYRLKWLCSPYPSNNSQVAIYYDAGTTEDLTDDESVMFSSITDQDDNTSSPVFYDLAEDHDGTIWLVTSSGPYIIPSPVTTFNYASAESTQGIGLVQRIKIPRNDGTNLADYLLPNTECVCIFVDPANCKWIGTKGDGLYRVSADGLTQLEHFTTDNSPLFGDLIYGLCFDYDTGALYIATEGGICSYQTDAQPSADDWKSLYCYPNPVRPDFSGSLTIGGLQEGCTVVITDATNHTIYRSVAQCGTLTWDLNGNDGSRVKPGVYIIHAIGQGGKKGATFKFLVM